MKKLILITLVSALSGFTLTGCGDETTNANLVNSNLPNINVVGNGSVPNTNAPNVNLPAVNTTNTANANSMSDAQSFVRTAAEDGMFEIRAGEMAATKAQNAEVKQFGQQMVTDHTKADDELKQLAKSENMNLPTDVSAEQKQKLDTLQGLTGAAFDREYMAMMVADHRKAVDLFESQANTGDNAKIKAFASRTLPVLQDHLEKARAINGKIK